MIWVGVLAVFISITLFVAAVGAVLTARKSRILQRLEVITKAYEKKEQIPPAIPHGQIRRVGIKRERQAKSSFDGFLSRLEGELSKTDILLRPKEYLSMSAIFALLLGAILTFITHSVIMMLIGIILGAIGSKFFLKMKRAQRMNKLNQQLVDTISFISNGLKAGYSFFQAAEMVARDMRPPMSLEFKKMIRQMNMGMPTEEALRKLGERVESQDLDLVITAILIQRQVGGNLAEVLDKITETIQGRIRLKGEIRAKTAQGKISGLILILLTPFIGVIISIISPQFIGPLFTNPLGWFMIGTALFLQVIGILATVKIVNIEV